MRKMKAVTIVMLVSLLVLLLSACGGGNGGSGGNEGGANTAANTETANDAAANDAANTAAEGENADAGSGDPEYPAIDLGGATIKIAAWWDMTPKPDNESGELLVAKLDEVQKKYNVKIEYLNVPYDQYKEKLITSTTAGQPFADITYIDSPWMPGLVKQGLLVPFDELVEDRATLQENDYGAMFDTVGVYDGKQYAWDSPKAEAGTGVFYNKTLLEKLGMKDLNEYVKEGNWNWDTFAAAAKEATRDSDGDGKIDTWGMTAYHADFLFSLVASNGGQLYDDKNMKEGFSSPETIQALEFLQKLYFTDKVARFNNAGDWGEQRKLFPEGNVLMMPGYIWEINDMPKNMGENKWSFVPFPKAPGAEDYVSGYGSLSMKAVPKGTKYPKEVMQILFELNDIHPSTEEEYVGQTWYESVVTDEAALENLRLAAEKTYIGWHNAITDYPSWTIADEVVKGQPVSTTVEKNKAIAQAKIDETFK